VLWPLRALTGDAIALVVGLKAALASFAAATARSISVVAEIKSLPSKPPKRIMLSADVIVAVWSRHAGIKSLHVVHVAGHSDL
jgi:hypothetical protein